MSFWGDRRAKQGRSAPPNVGALLVLFGADELQPLLAEDVAISEGVDVFTISYEARTIADITARIALQKPAIVHLLATFGSEGSLTDETGVELELRELMQAAEENGVGLFVIGCENRSETLVEHAHCGETMCLLAITERNRHYPSFMRSILIGLDRAPTLMRGVLISLANASRFALAYEALARQGPDWVQEGRPLPGSIALCPNRKGGSILMRSLAQP
jgi:hypothetical protein